VVSGAVSVDESQLTGVDDTVRKRPGDEVFSGSFATAGSGRYVAEQVSTSSLANRITAGARSFRRVITPLQGEINLVIRVVLGIVLYLEVLLVVRGLVQSLVLGDVVADATLLAGLVPNGLFVSIAVAYALGAVRIIRFGALVQQSNAIESLSHVDVLCLDKTGTLTANRLEVEGIAGLGGATEDEVASALAAVGACATARNKTTEAIAARWPEAPRAVAAEVPFSSPQVEPPWPSRARRDGTVADGPRPPTPDPGREPGIVPSRAARPAAVPRARWRAVSPPPGRSSRRGRRPGRSGLRVLLWHTHDDARRFHREDESTATLPGQCGPRPRGLLDELRGEAEATLRAFREAGVTSKISRRRPPRRSCARPPGRPRDAASIAGRARHAGRPASPGRAEATCSADHARKEGAAGRRPPGRRHYVAMIATARTTCCRSEGEPRHRHGHGSQATRARRPGPMQDSFAPWPRPSRRQRILKGAGHPQDVLTGCHRRARRGELVVVWPSRSAAQCVRPPAVHGRHPERDARRLGPARPPGPRHAGPDAARIVFRRGRLEPDVLFVFYGSLVWPPATDQSQGAARTALTRSWSTRGCS